MDGIVVLLAGIALLSIFGALAAAFGADSRDSFRTNHPAPGRR